jgi:hypothetical protein
LELIRDLLPDSRIDLAVSGHLNQQACLILDLMVDRFHQSTIDRGYEVQVSDHLLFLVVGGNNYYNNGSTRSQPGIWYSHSCSMPAWTA